MRSSSPSAASPVPAYLIHAMAMQTSDLGRLLGQGVKRVANRLGGNAGDFALHVKGLVVPGLAPPGTPPVWG